MKLIAKKKKKKLIKNSDLLTSMFIFAVADTVLCGIGEIFNLNDSKCCIILLLILVYGCYIDLQLYTASTVILTGQTMYYGYIYHRLEPNKHGIHVKVIHTI